MSEHNKALQGTAGMVEVSKKPILELQKVQRYPFHRKASAAGVGLVPSMLAPLHVLAATIGETRELNDPCSGQNLRSVRDAQDV